MTDLRNTPRYIRNTDAFGWQGADDPKGPWRSITPPQTGTPWQSTTSPIYDLWQASADVSGVEVLSPAAQAVLDAFRTSHTGQGCLAAALRAVAEQVGPSEILPPGYAYSAPAEMWHYEFKLKAQRQILAIAKELEATS